MCTYAYIEKAIEAFADKQYWVRFEHTVFQDTNHMIHFQI